MRTDRRTDMMKLTVTFRNSAHSPNKLVLTDESVYFILYYSDFGVVLSSYSSHLLACIRRYVLSGKRSFMSASFLDILFILSPALSKIL
jgi:hypothetical protein